MAKALREKRSFSRTPTWVNVDVFVQLYGSKQTTRNNQLTEYVEIVYNRFFLKLTIQPPSLKCTRTF